MLLLLGSDSANLIRYLENCDSVLQQDIKGSSLETNGIPLLSLFLMEMQPLDAKKIQGPTEHFYKGDVCGF
jgi:hypothetical protein